MGLAKDSRFHMQSRDCMEDPVSILIPLGKNIRELLEEESERLGMSESDLAARIVMEHLRQIAKERPVLKSGQQPTTRRRDPECN